jgi:NAD+ kinase
MLYRTIQDPASQRLAWYKPPTSVMVIKKLNDASVIPPFIQLVEFFIEKRNMVVFVESAVMDDPLLTENPGFRTEIKV